MIGALFRRGMCRCGSVSDAHPLRADAPPAGPAGAPPGPAFGELPGPASSWPCFTRGGVTVVYTLDTLLHPDHALKSALATLPAQTGAACVIEGIDLGTIDDAAHPAHVQAVALMGAHARAVFAARGFRVPDDVTIRLCTMGGEDADSFRGGTEPGLGHLWVSSRLQGANALLTVAHEVFHRVQYCYNANSVKTSPFYAALREGGARLAEDWVLDSGDRYLKDGIELLDDPGRPLMHHDGPRGTIPPHSYAAALFWRWLCEQHGELRSVNGDGHEVMRTMLERMIDPAGYTLLELREARGMVVGEGHLDSFQHLNASTGELLSTETDWGNFLVANWMHGTGKPVEDKRFDYVEDDDHNPPPGAERFSDTRPFVWPGEELDGATLAGKPYAFTIPPGTVRAGFSARYTVVKLDGAVPPMLRVAFEALEGMDDPLVQILLIRRDAQGREHLQDLLRSDAPRSVQLVPTAGLSQVVVIVAARQKAGRYRIAIDAAPSQPLLHAAPMNAAPGTSYETDPREGPWPWTSPDLGLVDGALRLRVTNRGDAASAPVDVAFAAQGTTPGRPVRAGDWRAVGTAQLPAIAPGGVAEVTVPWQAPNPPPAATGWALRATAAGAAAGERLVVLSSIGRLTRPARIDAVL